MHDIVVMFQDGKSPLYWVATYEGSEELTKLLLEKGADIDALNEVNVNDDNNLKNVNSCWILYPRY